MTRTLALLVAVLPALARDVRATYDLLKSGAALSAQQAAQLEQRVAARERDEESRIKLLAYYAEPISGGDLAAIRSARARHIHWLIENDQKEGLGLFQISTGVYRLNCQGDGLADPDSARRAVELWSQHLTKKRGDAEIRRKAVEAMQFCFPEQAEKLLLEEKNSRSLGNLYAEAVLGVTGWSYRSGDRAGSSPALRESHFARTARAVLEEATDRDLIAAAAASLLRQGAVLWADDKLEWDYTPLGNRLLAKARRMGADDLSLINLPTELPRRGERPPQTIRVGGNVQQAKLIYQAQPRYPQEAKDRRVTGTVELTALIGLDGKIIYLRPESGPPELISESIAAVRQWVYQPTLLNGKPCFVLTRIDVNYTMSQQ